MKTDSVRTVVEETQANTLDVLLDEHQARDESPASGPSCAMGLCVDERHPTLQGRVLVRWRAAGGQEQERWLPTLQGLPVRSEDRVLLMQPEGCDEPIVTGVIDGFAKRPVPEPSSAATLELKRDEAVRVVGADGKPLLELREGESGPVLTVLHDNLELATPGRLRLRGKSVELEAEQGSVNVRATDDVVVRGEVIKLN
ncbi:MAG: hypothetical protein KUG77_24685 [Nannocystaceae bacterium]|nr:hypothetical protein [Nannocystaceae bacterium]